VRIEEADLREYTHSKQYSDLQEILHQALEQLPSDQKMVVMMRDYEGYSYQEIGEMTGLSESQVKVYIYRARVFLRKYIGKMEVVV
jgi:RNA polymerase sigma-70 factor (ECF subfamily)